MGQQIAMGAVRKRVVWGLATAVLATSAWAQSIDTASGWNGSTALYQFGLPNTATYGQTITAPVSASVLQGFSFRINPQGVAFPFQAHVYEWDPVNSRATGPVLYTSPVVSSTPVSVYETHGFAVPNLALVPGKPYVLFASVSNTPGPIAGSFWGLIDPGSYAGGNVVFQNNGTDASLWTNAAWVAVTGYDFAFTATIVSAPDAPTITAATPGNGQASFTLAAPASNGGAAIQQYGLSCVPQGGGAAVAGSSATLSITLTGLTNGTTYDCTATATNAVPMTGSASAVVSVMPVLPPLVITPVSLPAGQVGVAYAPQTLAGTGGVAPLSWSVVSGLPAGMSLSPAGELSGTPTTAGPYSVVVLLSDSQSPAVTQQVTLSLTVDAAAAAATVMPVPTLGEWGLGLLAALTAALGMRRRMR